MSFRPIYHWAPPVRFGTNDLTSGRVVPIRNFPHSCKYSTGLDLNVCWRCNYNCQFKEGTRRYRTPDYNIWLVCTVKTTVIKLIQYFQRCLGRNLQHRLCAALLLKPFHSPLRKTIQKTAHESWFLHRKIDSLVCSWHKLGGIPCHFWVISPPSHWTGISVALQKIFTKPCHPWWFKLQIIWKN